MVLWAQPPTNFKVLARNMIKEVDHPNCGPMKLVNTPVKFSYSEPSIRLPPPLLGQHTDEILRDIVGMGVNEIQRLRKEGIVA
jgi:succinate--hydroxymethylglutarate CoA-transferase